jgi:3-hydroxyisobutyrate dehydrogenase-like beta-hydroxyacid dehydrogenase
MTGETITKVGFTGLGDQGAPMARAIAEAGFDLHVWARRPQTLEVLHGLPHVIEDTPRSLAAMCDIVCLCLRDDQDILDLLGNGLRDGLRTGAILANHGTGDPVENRRLAAELGRFGIAYLDAPVSGGRPGAVARTLTTIVGGSPQAFECARTVFEAFSRKVAYLGASGSGQMAKLLNNAMTMSNLKNAVDVFKLGADIGIDLAQLHEVISMSSGSSAVLQAIGTDITMDIAPHLQGLMRKDIEHFADAIRSAGQDPGALRDRALAGAEGLADLVSHIGKSQSSMSSSV